MCLKKFNRLFGKNNINTKSEPKRDSDISKTRTYMESQNDEYEYGHNVHYTHEEYE